MTAIKGMAIEMKFLRRLKTDYESCLEVNDFTSHKYTDLLKRIFNDNDVK